MCPMFATSVLYQWKVPCHSRVPSRLLFDFLPSFMVTVAWSPKSFSSSQTLFCFLLLCRSGVACLPPFSGENDVLQISFFRQQMMRTRISEIDYSMLREIRNNDE